MLHAEAGGENDDGHSDEHLAELDFEGAVFPEDGVLVLALGESVPGDTELNEPSLGSQLVRDAQKLKPGIRRQSLQKFDIVLIGKIVE